MNGVERQYQPGNVFDALEKQRQELEMARRAEVRADEVSEVSDDLGEMRSGRFLALISGSDPTDGDAEGAFVSAVPIVFENGEAYIGGVSGGLLEAGIGPNGVIAWASGKGRLDRDAAKLTGLGYGIQFDAENSGNAKQAWLGMNVKEGEAEPGFELMFSDKTSTILLAGDFSSGLEGFAKYSGSGTFVHDAFNGYFGGGCAKSVVVSPVGTSVGAGRSFTIVESNLYSVSVYARWETLNSASVKLVWKNASGGSLSTTHLVNNNGELSKAWAKYSGYFVPPKGAVTLEVQLYAAITSQSGGSMFVDKLYIDEYSGARSIRFEPDPTIRGGNLRINNGALLVAPNSPGAIPSGYSAIYPNASGQWVGKTGAIEMALGSASPTYYNQSGAQLSAGDVVVIDLGNDRACKTTTTAGSLAVLGVVEETIDSTALGRVAAIAGQQVEVMCDTGEIKRGMYLVTSSTTKQAKGQYARTPACFAKALTAKAAGSAGKVWAMILDHNPVAMPSIDALSINGWWQPEGLAGFAEGAPVDTWAGANGTAIALAQGTAANRPLVRKGLLNGFDVVQFDGANDVLATPANHLNTAGGKSMIAVYRALVAQYGVCGVTSGANTHCSMGANSGSPSAIIQGTTITGPTLVTTEYVIGSMIHDGTVTRIYKNGLLTNTHANTFSPIGTMKVGALQGASWYYLSAYIPEVITAQTYWDDTLRRSVEEYLSAKFGIPLA